MSATFRSVAFIKGEALISMWIPKDAALIRGQRLSEVRLLLEEMRYRHFCSLPLTGFTSEGNSFQLAITVPQYVSFPSFYNSS